MDTLTGEPMKIFETFLDLLFKKREARLANVPVATAIPVQVLALPAPAIQLIDIQEIDVQEPALESVVIEEIKEEAKEEVYVEAEIITDVEAIEVQEEIPEQISESLSPSVNTSVSKRSLRKLERKIKELYTFFLSRSIEDDDEVIFIKDIFDEKEKDALLNNIREFVTKDKPEFKTVIEGEKEELTKCDFYHLFHAIGFHAGKNNPGRAISIMIKESIPEYTKGIQPGTIYAKMTNTEDPHKIPVFDKDEDLPKSPDFADDIS